MRLFLEGRGEGNPSNLASWNAATGESAFFDIVNGRNPKYAEWLTAV